VIVTKQGKDSWRLTVLYGEAQVSERYKTWDQLSRTIPLLNTGVFITKELQIQQSQRT
jgi:hypothetical protein